ncbi:MAG TPA: hypothetical protein VN019_10610 [Oxalicibacterium sp.]|nr:hypothetical protein [Oxalicibacterium sp.]
METVLELNQRKITDFVHDVIRTRDPDLAAQQQDRHCYDPELLQAFLAMMRESV